MGLEFWFRGHMVEAEPLLSLRGSPSDGNAPTYRGKIARNCTNATWTFRGLRTNISSFVTVQVSHARLRTEFTVAAQTYPHPRPLAWDDVAVLPRPLESI